MISTAATATPPRQPKKKMMIPKNDRIYSEYFDWSENSDGSEISGSKYSDDGGSAGIRIHIFIFVSISGHRYANDMVKSMLER